MPGILPCFKPVLIGSNEIMTQAPILIELNAVLMYSKIPLELNRS